MPLLQRRSLALSLAPPAMLCLAAMLTGAAPGVAAEESRIAGDDFSVAASATLAKVEYSVVDANDDGVVRIVADGVTLDFAGATLNGADAGASPDAFHGIGVLVENCRGVTIKNARLRGFKVGILARNCQDLTIESCDVSDNYKQHLLSTPDSENGADWLFGHENDANEWLRYGAGMYLDRCLTFTLRGNTGRRGQNGICLNASNEGRVFDNDMSFNSGWGLGMYRSNRNQVAHNKFDWCIRGYSHGVYNRGQDSAGILVFEQCSDNVFAFNSATHGGDGFFLFAGLETLEETGTGGSNRNLLYRNDFSHASNNGIEATFSDGNRFVENTLDQADHAIWAGYSYNTLIVGNRISRCNHGISIEHGSENRIEGNTFEKNGIAVNVWSGTGSPFAAKPYGKDHRCRSEGYDIVRNRFTNNRLDLRLARTDDVRIRENEFAGAAEWLRASEECKGIEVDRCNVEGPSNVSADVKIAWGLNHFSTPPASAKKTAPQAIALDLTRLEKTVAAPTVPGSLDTRLPPETLRGLEYIFVDEWGPYDFASVKLVPGKLVAWRQADVRLLGPSRQRFEVKGVPAGVSVSPLAGELPAALHIAAEGAKSRQFAFTVSLPDSQQELPFGGLLLHADWNVTFFRWPANGPQKPPADWQTVLKSEPLEERSCESIDFRWGGGAPGDRVPSDYFATVSTAEIELPAGKYRLRTVSDDGVRVYLGNRLAIDNWTWHPPKEDTADVELQGGKHAIKIEHFEIDGVSQLQFWIEPR